MPSSLSQNYSYDNNLIIYPWAFQSLAFLLKYSFTTMNKNAYSTPVTIILYWYRYVGDIY